jgi:hypothetical protein
MDVIISVSSAGSLTREHVRDKYANGCWDVFNEVLCDTDNTDFSVLKGAYYLQPEVCTYVPYIFF